MSRTHFSHPIRRGWQRWRIACAAVLLFALALYWQFGAPQPLNAQDTIPTPPAWLEPRGVNVVDLVGVVPDDHLRGAVISYATGTGLLEYESGVRQGDNVTIRAKVAPHYGSLPDGTIYTIMTCLAQPALFDQWLSTAPATTLRLYSGDQELTHLIYYLAYSPAGLTPPQRGVGDWDRYPRTDGDFVTPGPNGLEIPANNGCFIAISGRQSNLIAEFRAVAPQKITAQFILKRECTAHSYIGYLDPTSETPLEATGVLAPLARQMALRFGDRHDKCPLESPDAAEFVLIKFPPTPFDPYAPNAFLQDPLLIEQDPNFNIAGSGTYRLEARGGGLSVDHVSSIGLPLHGQWQDADQSSGKQYLNHFTDLVHLSSPEYFIPPGFSWNGSHYDPCMIRGGCPDELLDALYNATYTFQIYYYHFTRTEQSDLLRIPLQQVGIEWTPAIAEQGTPLWLATAPDQTPSNVFIPLIGHHSDFRSTIPDWQPGPGDDAAGCPCGWFDLDGRMYDYIAKPN